MAEGCRFFYQAFESYDEKAAKKNLKPAIQVPLQDFRDGLKKLPEWDQAQIHNLLEQTCEAHELKLGKLAQPIRVAVAGRAVSPPIDITLKLLGRETVIVRLDRALTHIKNLV